MTSRVQQLAASIVLVAGLLAQPAALAAPIDDRMSLIEAIDTLRADGIEIVYSSRLVKPWMRVRETPQTEDPLAALDLVLRHYELELIGGDSGRWLVTRGSPTPRRRPPPPAAIPAADADPPAALVPLDEVVVVASRYGLYSRRAPADQFLNGEEIRLMPHLADDAFRALQRLPGAAAGDFTASFNLRGGAADEIKVVVDGVELFEPYHMRTLFNPLSIVDPGIIGSAEVFSGGFTAEHGNHMSGVLEIASRRAEAAPVHELGVSFVSAFARSFGAFDGGRGSYLVSARRGYLDLMADAVVDEDEELSPRYGDLFARLSYAFTESAELSAHLLLGDDDVEFYDPNDGEDFGGETTLRYAWIDLDVVPSARFRWKSGLFVGRVDTLDDGVLLNPPLEVVTRRDERNVDIAGLQTELAYYPGANHAWTLGARYRRLEADYDYFLDSLRQTDIANGGVPFSLNRDIELGRDGDEIGAFLSWRFRPLPTMVWEAGVRWDKQTYLDSGDATQTSPRLNALLQIGARSDLRLAWGRFHQPQGVHELQVHDGVTQFFPAQVAEHRVLGLSHQFANGVELQADVYSKHYDDLRPRFENVFDVYEFAPESNFDRVRLDPLAATADGIELTLRRRSELGLDWWVSYTRSEVTDRIGNTDIPRAWDQRNALTASLTWHGERWSVSAVARYHDGWPRTPLFVDAVLNETGGIVGVDADFSRRNTEAFDDYSRLDLRFSRKVGLRHGEVDFYLEIFNVLNSDNECCVDSFDLALAPNVSASPNIDSYLPIFPSFGFVWRFGPGLR